MDDVFKQNPKLEKYYSTSDGEAFYNENDAKNHAKNLEVKTVETVFNELFLDVIKDEELSEEEKEALQLAEQEKAKEAKAELEKSLLAFDSANTKYNDAVKLFRALGLTADSEKQDVIYPILLAEQAKVKEANTTQA
ncbi:hypothetical protein [Flavobacterium sp. N1994]|uniref:hypothetical protein n=1 Tax=Flavobacterium sp. N1994 TaxID=2986827 RepID=UPI0022216A68|nr:hypothetical protein [Flavobacterium sp. N1994]